MRSLVTRHSALSARCLALPAPKPLSSRLPPLTQWHRTFEQTPASFRRTHRLTPSKSRPAPPLYLQKHILVFRRTFNKNRPPGSFFGNARILFYHYPVSITVATVIILMGMAGIIYVNYVYQTYIIGAFHKFPEEVAKPLRRAMYYTNYDVNPKEALKYYKQALMAAKEVGMDPFSDEVIGVQIQLAAFLEQIRQLSAAIDVLEQTRNDLFKWMDFYKDAENKKRQQTSVLIKAIQISVKLGELYADPVIWDRDLAEERLVWAVETSLKERQRRDVNKVDEEEEGPWLDADSMGAAIESLAHRYEDRDQHYLAAPLFLQALSLYPTRDCHSVVLMNNLASSIAQQSPRAAQTAQNYAASKSVTGQSSGPVASRETLIENAKVWAQKALEVAAAIKPPERNEECDMGCAVALHNLGEFAEMSKDFAEAKRKYKEAISLAKAVGFSEGVQHSTERLRKIANSG